jgi:acylphosphatase
MKVNKLITVEGRVQHVGFRYSARNAAKNLYITGLASNLIDGNVFIEAEGEEENVLKFIDWCRLGPPLARVFQVKIQDGVLKDYPDFSIR